MCESESHSVVSDTLQPHGLLPGLSVHGILQARILDWVDIFLQGILLTQGLTWVSCIAG